MIETIPSTLADVVESGAGLASHIVCLCHTFSSEWSFGHGKRSGTVRSCCSTTIPGIFCIGGPSWVQKILLCSREDLLCSYHVLKETPVLF
jgi:hypothetical protein